MSLRLTRDDLARLCPRPTKGAEAQKNWDGYIAALTSPEGYALFDKFGINTRMELCAFLGNMAEETGDNGGFTALWENLSFSTVAAIRRAWKFRASRYSDSWIQKNLLRKPVALGDWAYGGRMGNGVNNGDGYRFRGFGAMQTTGRDSHMKYYPDGVYTYTTSLRAALMEWKDKNCDLHIAAGDFRTVCVLINGGTNGLALREQYFAKAQTIWKDDPDWTPEDPIVAVVDDPDPSLVLGPSLPEVVTASDLKGTSRKIDFLFWVRSWASRLGLGGAGGTTYSLEDANTHLSQAATTLDILKANPLLLISILTIVGSVGVWFICHYMLQLHTDDYNNKRWMPSKLQPQEP
jgi:predicted chitinase